MIRDGLLRAGGLIAILLAVWGAQWWQPTAWVRLANSINDFKLRAFTGEPSQDVVFVDIGADAEARFGRWPWPRDTLATLFEKLRPARWVLLDMVFSAPTEPDKDQALADTMASMPSLIGGFFLRPDQGTQGADSLDWLTLSALPQVLPDPRLKLPSSPFPEQSTAAIRMSLPTQGAFNVFPDADGVLRHYPLAVESANLVLPSLGLQGLRLALNSELTLQFQDQRWQARLGESPIPINERAFVSLTFYPLESYPRISLLELATPEGQARIAGKIVVLGISEAGVADIVSTPIGRIPGPLVHCTFLHNFFQGHFPQTQPFLQEALLLGIGLAVFAIGLVGILGLRLTLFALFGAALYGLSHFLYTDKLIVTDAFSLGLALIGCATFSELLTLHRGQRRLKTIDRAVWLPGSSPGVESMANAATQRMLHKPLHAALLRVEWPTATFPVTDGQAVEKAINAFHAQVYQCIAEQSGTLVSVDAGGCTAVFGLHSDVRNPKVLQSLLRKLLDSFHLPQPENALDAVVHPMAPTAAMCCGELLPAVFGVEVLRACSLTGPAFDQLRSLLPLARKLGPGVLLTDADTVNSLSSQQGNGLCLFRDLPLPPCVQNTLGIVACHQVLANSARNRLLKETIESPDGTVSTKERLQKAAQLYRDTTARHCLQIWDSMPPQAQAAQPSQD